MKNAKIWTTFLIFLLPLFITNSPVFAADKDVIVNEIMYDFAGSDTDHEWIELFNKGDNQVTIVGGSTSSSWRITDGSNHTLSSTASQGSMAIGPKEFVIIAQNAQTFLSDNPGFSGNLIESSAVSLNNSSGTVSLRIGSNGETWGEFTYQNSQGANGDGNSLQRKTDGSIVAARPTPGKENAIDPAPTLTATLAPSSTSTPTPTTKPTSTPTKTPTPTPTTKPSPTPKTLTPTKIPTPTPIKSGPTVAPILIAKDVQESTREALPTSILGESTESAANNISLTDNPQIKVLPNVKETKTLASSTNILSKILIGIGVIFLIVCGILAFRSYIKRRRDTEDI